MNETTSENYRPFAFDRLEQKTVDYLDKIREEARRIAERTKEEIASLKERTEQDLFRLKAALDAEKEEIERRKIELKNEETRLLERQGEIDRQISEESRKSGFELGLEEGKAEGIRQGNRQFQAELEIRLQQELEKKLNDYSERLLPPLQKMSEELIGVRQSLINFWEGNILQISAAIAYQAIMTELPKIKEIPLGLLQEAIDLCVGCSTLKIRMNPQNVKELQTPIESILKETTKIASPEIVADPNITPGGCVVEVGQGSIDQQIETRLERIISELSDLYAAP